MTARHGILWPAAVAQARALLDTPPPPSAAGVMHSIACELAEAIIAMDDELRRSVGLSRDPR